MSDRQNIWFQLLQRLGLRKRADPKPAPSLSGNPPESRIQEQRDQLIALASGLSSQHKQLDRLSALVEGMSARQKQEDKWRRRVRRQLDALIRDEYVRDSAFSSPHNLISRRFVLHSQNEEDGITLALLKIAGVASRRFIEIGCGAKGGNSAVLAFEFDWGGLMVDANPTHVAGLGMLLGTRPDVTLTCASVSSSNINTLLRDHGITGEVDLLSIDVDSYDYWLLDAMNVCSPRLIIVEYNALFGPERAVTLPDTPRPTKVPKGYFGASLAALEKLARQKGYRLVVCEPSGMNAFFLRNDLAPELKGVTAAEGFRVALDRRALVDPRPVDINIYQRIEEQGLALVEV